MDDIQRLNRTRAAPVAPPGSGGQEPLKLVRVRASGSADIEALNAMMSASASHVLLTQGRLPSSNEGEKLFANLPSGARLEDKFLWCVWQHQRLVGCIEIIRHWPVRDVAYIGLLQVHEARMRLGLGMQILEMARQIARGWSGVRRLQLAVAENNAGASAFWRHAGFRLTGLIEQHPDFTAPLVVMERPLR